MPDGMRVRSGDLYVKLQRLPRRTALDTLSGSPWRTRRRRRPASCRAAGPAAHRAAEGVSRVGASSTSYPAIPATNRRVCAWTVAIASAYATPVVVKPSRTITQVLGSNSSSFGLRPRCAVASACNWALLTLCRTAIASATAAASMVGAPGSTTWPRPSSTVPVCSTAATTSSSAALSRTVRVRAGVFVDQALQPMTCARREGGTAAAWLETDEPTTRGGHPDRTGTVTARGRGNDASRHRRGRPAAGPARRDRRRPRIHRAPEQRGLGRAVVAPFGGVGLAEHHESRGEVPIDDPRRLGRDVGAQCA